MFLKHNGNYLKIDGSLFILKESEPPTPMETEYIQSNYNDMIDLVNDVIMNLNSDERLAIVIRHSERSSDTSASADITNHGKAYAIDLGKKIKATNKFKESECSFYGTNALRCINTANCIYLGMFNNDETTLSNVISSKVSVKSVADKATDRGDVFKLTYTSSSGWPDVADFARRLSNDVVMEPVSKNIIDGCVELMGDKKFCVCVSHDFNTLPFVCWSSGQTTSTTNHAKWFDFQGNVTHNEWLCYMAGVAIIIKKNLRILKPIYTITRKLIGESNLTNFTDIAEGGSGWHGVMRSTDNSGYGNVL